VVVGTAGDDRQTRVNLCGSQPLKCPVSLKGANNVLVSLHQGVPPTVSRACHNDNGDMNIHDFRTVVTFSGVASAARWRRLISVKRHGRTVYAECPRYLSVAATRFTRENRKLIVVLSTVNLKSPTRLSTYYIVLRRWNIYNYNMLSVIDIRSTRYYDHSTMI